SLDELGVNDTDLTKMNHLNISFLDGSERHFLFTDTQIDRAIKTADKKSKSLPDLSWVREVWYEGLMDTDKHDISSAISDNGLPKMAKNYNHIRVQVNGKNRHLLFTNTDVRKAFLRAANRNKLPKHSW